MTENSIQVEPATWQVSVQVGDWRCVDCEQGHVSGEIRTKSKKQVAVEM